MDGTHQRFPVGERVLELLDDPIVQLVMRRDGVTRQDVLAIMGEARRGLFGGAIRQPGASAFRGNSIRLAA